MIKIASIGFCLLISCVTLGQNGTASPYSYFGVGEKKFNGTLESKSMGGVFVAPDSIHMNFQNPASYSTLKLTSFSAGVGYNTSKFKTETQTDEATRGSLDYLAIGLSMGKVGIGFGLMPYSSVGYKINSPATDTKTENSYYDGTGGVNSLFFGLSYSILPNLSVGADLRNNFGLIKKKYLVYTTNVAFGSYEINESTLSGFEYSFGVMYQKHFAKKLNLYTSFAYTPPVTTTIDNVRTVAVVSPSGGADPSIMNKFEDVTSKSSFKLSDKFLGAIGVGKDKNWLVSGQVVFQDLSGYSDFNNAENAIYGKNIKYSFGGYFIPNYNIYSKYYSKINYRAGVKYEDTGLKIYNEPIKDMGVNVGLGFPIPNSFSNVNLGLELGRKGTTNAGLVEDNYFNISISFSFNDRWFTKRKID